jgi:hypothetical protein
MAGTADRELTSRVNNERNPEAAKPWARRDVEKGCGPKSAADSGRDVRDGRARLERSIAVGRDARLRLT